MIQAYKSRNRQTSIDRNTLTFDLPLGLTIRVIDTLLHEKNGNINVLAVYVKQMPRMVSTDE